MNHLINQPLTSLSLLFYFFFYFLHFCFRISRLAMPTRRERENIIRPANRRLFVFVLALHVYSSRRNSRGEVLVIQASRQFTSLFASLDNFMLSRFVGFQRVHIVARVYVLRVTCIYRNTRQLTRLSLSMNTTTKLIVIIVKKK